MKSDFAIVILSLISQILLSRFSLILPLLFNFPPAAIVTAPDSAAAFVGQLFRLACQISVEMLDAFFSVTPINSSQRLIAFRTGVNV
ncbi:hypothetical protein WM94_10305 [Pseudomonas sp. ABFPK]|nr:hypothetical protein WM94_10305 [Pseudomonas sp. ABFPK]